MTTQPGDSSSKVHSLTAIYVQQLVGPIVSQVLNSSSSPPYSKSINLAVSQTVQSVVNLCNSQLIKQSGRQSIKHQVDCWAPLNVASPQFDGLVVLQSCRGDDVLRRVTRRGDDHVWEHTGTEGETQRVRHRGWDTGPVGRSSGEESMLARGGVLPVCPCSFWTISLVCRFQMYTMLSSDPDTIHYNTGSTGSRLASDSG